MDYVNTLNNYPRDLFSTSFKKINETKTIFQKYEEYIKKPLVKCCVLGNTSTGKSTVINVLMGSEILYEGQPEATLCVVKCQAALNNEEYFDIYTRNVCIQRHLPTNEVRNVNRTNTNYLNVEMTLENYLDVYLNVPNHWILNKFSFIDCPGFNVNNLNDILNYCKCAHIIIFCFRARSGITDNDISKINEVKRVVGRFQISFIINCCDESVQIDKQAIIERLKPFLTGQDAIYFISSKEEKEGNLNDERHREFERFKKCLQNQKSHAAISFRRVFGDLICSATDLLDCLNFTNFQESQFSDISFTELQGKIFNLINNDQTVYYKDDIDKALMEYSDKVNKEISKFMLKQFIFDHNLNEGIINENYFFKEIIVNNDIISKPSFSWYNWGDQSDEMKKCFRGHFTDKRKLIIEEIKQHYSGKVRNILIVLGNYKNAIRSMITKIEEIQF